MAGLISCQGKMRYPGFSGASGAALRMKRHTGEIANAYHCRFCGGFHVGTVSPERNARPKFKRTKRWRDHEER